MLNCHKCEQLLTTHNDKTTYFCKKYSVEMYHTEEGRLEFIKCEQCLIDNNICPKCKTEQTYNRIQNGIKICNNCGKPLLSKTKHNDGPYLFMDNNGHSRSMK